MDFVKQNKVLIAIVLTVLIVVLIRSLSIDHFKTDAIKWAEPSISRSNIISPEKIGTLPGEKLFVNLDETSELKKELSKDTLHISASTILNKDNLKKIFKHNGPVLLFSGKPEVSIRIWMLLSQLGYKNLYVLTTESDNEVLKYKFNPDSSTKAGSSK
jgi:hypothetical protein